ncbi:YbaN family protein [Vagococcus bubulae]|uniref:DUF454 domain-containing protein n=1 Tax=Vagococcus bubulae TaxID=1977868 RepID=A0A429ZBY9_9ENTE|nr:YbaN family protein [Vagococcus bubulae]RST91218.1 hypothetical protein CBF36_10370 [Vagococcus bubulae]
MKRIIFFILGCITFILGTIGIIIPLLPTVPFYLAASFFWVNSSKKVHAYFIKTKWYNQYVKEYIVEKKMSKTQQYKILITVFCLLAIPFVMVPNTIMRIALILVFVGHVIFFRLYFSNKRKISASKAEGMDI